jgi:hypothetical protein
MATNQVYNHGNQFQVTAAQVTTPTGAAAKVSGAPGLVDVLPVVLLTSPQTDSAGVSQVTVKTDGVYTFPVNANNGAIGVGERVYAVTAPAATLTLTNTATSSTAFGYALGTVASGETTEIPVKIHP